MPVGTPVLLRDDGFAITTTKEGKTVRLCNDRFINGYIGHAFMVETPKEVYWLYDIFLPNGTLFARSMKESEFTIRQEV